ncbi:MAG: type II toxin-antitoxin system RelE/ParE family toxin [Elusimicrobiota bacterium]
MIYTDSGGDSGYQIEYYVTESGACPTQELLDAMPYKHVAKTQKFFMLLETTGPNLPRPYADSLGGKIRELIIDIQHHGYRFLHFYSSRTIVITHGFLKKTPRTPPHEIVRAERAMNSWLRRRQP